MLSLPHIQTAGICFDTEHPALQFTTQRLISSLWSKLPYITFTFAESYLSDGMQQFAIGVEDDAERQEQAEGEQADDVGDIVWRLGPPVNRAGGAGTLGTVFAPAQQRRNSPGHRVQPGEADPCQHWAVVSAVGHSGRHHGAVALVGQNGQGNQGDNA